MDNRKTIMDISSAIVSLVPTAVWAVRDGVLEWNDSEVTQPTDAEIDVEIIRLQAEYDAQEYARNRAVEYPSNGDQWDMIYKDNLNSTTTHKDAVEAVKTKWPKDNTGPVE
jgi:hypothetical protein